MRADRVLQNRRLRFVARDPGRQRQANQMTPISPARARIQALIERKFQKQFGDHALLIEERLGVRD